MGIRARAVTETGDNEADVTRGLGYEEAPIQHSKRFGSFLGRGALEAVLQEVVLRGKVGPIEQGFLGRIAMAAI
ncbi:hypothetical protein, partial [Acinetobacter baumannii]|uniref:hypothetical protein n=1 Tax=Acinetobacter baumannii TaxID=470 RepID=UPI001BB46DFF